MGTARPVLDLGTLIDRRDWSGFQKYLLCLVSFIIFLDGFDTQTLTLALPAIIKLWHSSKADFGPIIGIGFIAMAAGTYFGGNLADRVGRRPALIVSMLVFGIGTFAGAFVQDLWQLAGARIVAAIGLGAAMPNATALITEYTPFHRRTLAVSVAMGSVPVGAFVGGMLAAFVLPSLGWRWLFAISGALPVLASFALMLTLPESIRFLLHRRGDQARVRRLLTRMGHDIPEGATVVDEAESTTESNGSRPGVRTILGAPYGLRTVTLSLAFFFVLFANMLIISWVPTLLADAGFDLSVTSKALALFSIGGLIGSVGGAALLRRTGAATRVMIMAALAVAMSTVLAAVHWSPATSSVAALLCAMLGAGCFIPGTQVLLFGLAGSAYPTAMRGTGVGFTAATGRIGAVTSGFAGAALLASGSSAFFGAAGAAMVAVIAAVAVLRLSQTSAPAVQSPAYP